MYTCIQYVFLRLTYKWFEAATIAVCLHHIEDSSITTPGVSWIGPACTCQLKFL